MNALDIIIIIILFGSLIRGFQLGLIRQLIHFLGFFIALYMAYRFSGELAPYLQEKIPAPSFENSTIYMFSEVFQLENMFYSALAFFIIFVFSKLILNLGGQILHQIASLPGLKTVNRFSGGLLGLLQAVILTVLIIHVISVMPWLELQQYVEGSTIAQFMLGLTPIITEVLYNLWNTSVQI